MTRRELLRVGGLGSMVALLAACQPKVVEKIVEKEVTKIIKEVVKETIIVEGTPQVVEKEVTRIIEVTRAPELKKWTLVFQAGLGAPTDPEMELAEGEMRYVGLQPAVDDYKDVKPNVEIEWYDMPPGAETAEWLHARMAARDCPDIFWYNANQLWPQIHKGWALDMTEWVNTPNPYMPGKRAWVSYIDKIGRKSQIGPDGKIYGVNFDGAGVMIVYNKDAFADAGVTEEPVTWGEFMEVWQKLKDKDYIPFGGDLGAENCCYCEWTITHIINQTAYDVLPDYDDDKGGLINAKEMVQHFQKGDWPLWDHLLRIAQLFREQAPFLPMGYQGEVDYRKLFRQGSVAMYMEGSWQVMQFETDPVPFDYGWVFYPLITKDIWPTAPEKHVRLQGAWGVMQYHVPGYLAETDPERIPVIMDWLMFMTQAKYISGVCGERGNIPMVEGSTTVPQLAPFLLPYDRKVTYDGAWLILAQTAYARQRQLLAEYMPGGMSDDDFLAKGKEIWADEVRKVLEVNPDWKI